MTMHTGTRTKKESLRYQLTLIGRGLLWRHVLLSLILGFLTLAAGVCLIELAAVWGAVREAQAAVCFSGVTILALMVGAGFFLWRRKGFAPLALAKQTEQYDSQLKEALSCALEREGLEEGEQGPLDRTLIGQMRRRFSGLPVKQANQQFFYRTVPLSVAAFVALAVLLSVFQTNAFNKVAMHFAGEKGVRVSPGDVEVPINTDLTVNAEILRWQGPAQIQVRGASTAEKFKMDVAGEAGEAYAFTFYALQQPFLYRVVTPSLASKWYQVDVYQPPEIEDAKIVVTRPDYTRTEPSVYEQLHNVSCLRGSELVVTVHAPSAMQASIVALNGEWQVDMSSGEEGRFKCEFVAKRSHEAQVVLTDSEGRLARSDVFDIDCVPDMPPAIDILAPPGDVHIPPGNRQLIEGLSGDDWGISSVAFHYRISGGEPQSKVLYDINNEEDKDTIKEMEILHAVDADDKVEAGDVISWQVSVTDNRQPEPQTTRSEVSFIEIRPELKSKEGQGGGESEKIELAPILEELRRMIRLSYRLTHKQREGDGEKLQELATGLADVRIATGEILEKIISKLNVPLKVARMSENFNRFYEPLKQGVDRVENAETMARNGMVKQAIPLEEEALAHLTAAALEAMQNAVSKKAQEQKNQGKGKEQSSQGKHKESEAKKQERPLTMQELDALREKLLRVADRQARLNSRFERLKSVELSDHDKKQLAKSENELQNETERIREALRKHRLLKPVNQTLVKAVPYLKYAGEAASDGALSRAGRHGLRARSQILRSLDQLNNLASGLAKAKVDALARQAEHLGQQQKSLADESGKAAKQSDDMSDEDVDALREQQKDIAEKTEQLLGQTKQVAGELEQKFPETAKRLRQQALDQATRNLPEDMERTTNALLYRFFNRSQSMQNESAAEIGRMQQQMQQIASGMPQVSEQQLLDALKQIEQTARKAQQNKEVSKQTEQQKEALKRSSQRLGETLSRLGEKLKNGQMKKLGKKMQGVAESGQLNPNQHPQMMRALRQATQRIREHLRRMGLKDETEMRQRFYPPPEQYRDLVEQYFKELSEDE